MTTKGKGKSADNVSRHSKSGLQGRKDAADYTKSQMERFEEDDGFGPDSFDRFEVNQTGHTRARLEVIRLLHSITCW